MVSPPYRELRKGAEMSDALWDMKHLRFDPPKRKKNRSLIKTQLT